MLVLSLCKAIAGDSFCSSIFTWYNANKKHLQGIKLFYIVFWKDFAGDSFWQTSLPVKVLVLQEVA